MSEPTRSIKLYGTDEPIVEPRVLKAGALSVELEAGNCAISGSAASR